MDMDAPKVTPTKGQVSFLIWLSKFAVVSGLTLEIVDSSVLLRAPHGGQFEEESGKELVHLLSLEAARLIVEVSVVKNDYGVRVDFSS
jgi:hypothetical protein